MGLTRSGLAGLPRGWSAPRPKQVLQVRWHLHNFPHRQRVWKACSPQPLWQEVRIRGSMSLYLTRSLRCCCPYLGTRQEAKPLTMSFVETELHPLREGPVTYIGCAGTSASQQSASQQSTPEGGLPTADCLVDRRGDAGASSSAAPRAQQRLRELPEFITERIRDFRSGNTAVSTTFPSSPCYFAGFMAATLCDPSWARDLSLALLSQRRKGLGPLESASPGL